ncbi:MAG: ribosome-associated translation inhibitor RaiA [Halobacteriovoraceae bacterium]|jgi:putative sigma-54 modulation protein|nr:ribosome-associated translation inhibitor RaiA [Halobacteriovoraceae bacterium]MBT5093354.1 ribosome-associated translation inhibitor RaiA [Halobacteriovoraceae bacterium]
MDLRIAYRHHLESSPSLEEKIHAKAERFKKHFKGKIKVNWVCGVDGNVHHSEVNVHAGDHHYHAHAEAESLYKTFDLAAAKIEKQLQKDYQRMKNKIHRRGNETLMSQLVG